MLGLGDLHDGQADKAEISTWNNIIVSIAWS